MKRRDLLSLAAGVVLAPLLPRQRSPVYGFGVGRKLPPLYPAGAFRGVYTHMAYSLGPKLTREDREGDLYGAFLKLRGGGLG